MKQSPRRGATPAARSSRRRLNSMVVVTPARVLFRDDGGGIMPSQKFSFCEGNSASYGQNCCELSAIVGTHRVARAGPANRRGIGSAKFLNDSGGMRRSGTAPA